MYSQVEAVHTGIHFSAEEIFISCLAAKIKKEKAKEKLEYKLFFIVMSLLRSTS